MWHSPCTKKNPVNISHHSPTWLLLGFHRIVVIHFLVVGTQCESLCFSYLFPHSLPTKVESKPLSGALGEESGNSTVVYQTLIHSNFFQQWIQYQTLYKIYIFFTWGKSDIFSSPFIELMCSFLQLKHHFCSQFKQ